ncbi:hypothetical protein TSAR_008259 [Trichomalopsis sarcophagae]|uniref:Protein FAM122A n=1 Tax=Trichomalopsis sarcophagae TaxID=543379 RepID=A0A232ETE3_9HYME|nr:hypothetical protein TSAR_008259 [Trichomalopsis sarcophagae]
MLIIDIINEITSVGPNIVLWDRSPGGPIGIGPRLTPRVNQLRRKECIDVVAGREAAHEKEIHSAMQISQSWEDLTFETEGLSFKDSSTESPPSTMFATASNLLPQLRTDKQMIPKKIFDPLSLSLSPGSPPSCSSPSLTRSGLGQRQCYSPSIHAVAWKNGSLSPSPTRKAFATRRSLSPISIRPSCLGGTGGAMKRKFKLYESGGMDRVLQPPIKRAFNLIMSNPSRDDTQSVFIDNREEHRFSWELQSRFLAQIFSTSRISWPKKIVHRRVGHFFKVMTLACRTVIAIHNRSKQWRPRYQVVRKIHAKKITCQTKRQSVCFEVSAHDPFGVSLSLYG